MRARHEVVGLDDDRYLAVGHGGHRHVVESTPEVVALQRRDRRGLAPQQIREQVEVVDRVGVGDADVGAGALEAGEAAGGVTHGADPATGQRCPQCSGHRVEAEDVADLHDSGGRAGGRGHRPAVGGGDGQRLLDEAVAAGGQTCLGHGAMAVGRRDDVDGIDVGQRNPEVLDGAGGRHPLPHRPLAGGPR